MSRIYFHTSDDTVAVSGAERAAFAIFCEGIAVPFLDRYSNGVKPLLLDLFPTDHYIHSMSHRSSDVLLAFRHLGSIVIDGEKTSPFSLFLNTAFALGNDAVKFAARVHGQCEIHCWAKGENRKWLAGIIKDGMRIGLYREGLGWESVVEMLEASEASHVVLSYSVCEGFPNQSVANYVPPVCGDEIDYDAWYDLDAKEQWRLGIEGLVSSDRGLELTPDNWDDFYFENGHTAMQLVAHLSRVKNKGSD